MTGRPARRSGAARPTLARAAAALALSLLALAPPAPTAAEDHQVIAAVVGDYGSPGANSAAVAALITSWTPDVVVTTGDNSYTGDLDADIGALYHGFIHPYGGRYGAGAAVNRFYPCLGNHDWDQGVDCDGESCHGAHLDYFALPGNERYYDFAAGPVRFFMVDSDVREPHGTTAGSAQAEWLKTALAASTARWNIVCFHHSPYSSGSASPGLRWPFPDWGATAVISAHLHVYERVMKSGFPYFVNGLGGRSKHPFGAIEPGSAIRFNAAFGAMRIVATAEDITFQFHAIDASEPIDTFVIKARTVAPTTWGAIKAAYR